MKQSIQNQVNQGLKDRADEAALNQRENLLHLLQELDFALWALHPTEQNVTTEQKTKTRTECLALARQLEPETEWKNYTNDELYKALFELA